MVLRTWRTRRVKSSIRVSGRSPFLARCLPWFVLTELRIHTGHHIDHRRVRLCTAHHFVDQYALWCSCATMGGFAARSSTFGSSEQRRLSHFDAISDCMTDCGGRSLLNVASVPTTHSRTTVASLASSPLTMCELYGSPCEASGVAPSPNQEGCSGVPMHQPQTDAGTRRQQ